MLRDRPAMARHVVEGDVVWNWAVRQFAGAHTGRLIHWSSKNPSPGIEAQHSHHPQFWIRIRPRLVHGQRVGEAKTFDDLWGDAVVELFNIRSHATFHAIYEEAIAGKLTRAEWLRRNAAAELKAVQRAHDFYREVWLPYRLQQGHRVDSDAWYAWPPPSTSAYIAQMRETERGRVWLSYWESYWDNSIVPYRAAMEKFEADRR